MLRRFHWIVLSSLLVLQLWALTAWAMLGMKRADHEPGEILVHWVSQPSTEAVTREMQRLSLSDERLPKIQSGVLQQAGVRSVERIAAINVERVLVPEGQALETVMAQLRTSPMVKSCELNYRRYAFAPLANGPNDYYYQHGDQWWLEAVQADRVWAEQVLPQGANVIVAIIDTGIMLSHPDLSGRLVAGKNFSRSSTADGNDDHGHGTHVAGIAAASTNNSIGIAGVASAPNIKLMPVKVLDTNGSGTDTNIANGVIWAANNGAKVLNLSLGGPNANDTLKDAIHYARNLGCLVVVAAGNEAVDDNGNLDNPVMYPAAYPDVVAVAACDKNGTRAYYSEFGSYVDIAAPGGIPSANSTSILSTYPSGSFTLPTYAYHAGTSMATPVVAGVAAMLFAQDLSRTPEQIENILITTAEKTGSNGYADGWNQYLGWGRVNCYKALTRQSTYAPRSSGRASYNYPNPFRPENETTYVVMPVVGGQTPTRVKLSIYDTIGHLVHSQDVSPAQATPGGVIAWDGRNDRGEAVVNGVYPYRLEIDGTVYTNKIVVSQ